MTNTNIAGQVTGGFDSAANRSLFARAVVVLAALAGLLAWSSDASALECDQGFRLTWIDYNGDGLQNDQTEVVCYLPGDFKDAESVEGLGAINGFQAIHADTLRLYDVLLGRKPDLGGAIYWLGVLEGSADHDVSTIATRMGDSDEFQAGTRGLSDTEFVDLLYRRALRRRGDAEGRAFWVSELASGRRTRPTVAFGFSLSDEFRQANLYVPSWWKAVGLPGQAPADWVPPGI